MVSKPSFRIFAVDFVFNNLLINQELVLILLSAVLFWFAPLCVVEGTLCQHSQTKAKTLPIKTTLSLTENVNLLGIDFITKNYESLGDLALLFDSAKTSSFISKLENSSSMPLFLKFVLADSISLHEKMIQNVSYVIALYFRKHYKVLYFSAFEDLILSVVSVVINPDSSVFREIFKRGRFWHIRVPSLMEISICNTAVERFWSIFKTLAEELIAKMGHKDFVLHSLMGVCNIFTFFPFTFPALFQAVYDFYKNVSLELAHFSNIDYMCVAHQFFLTARNKEDLQSSLIRLGRLPKDSSELPTLILDFLSSEQNRHQFSSAVDSVACMKSGFSPCFCIGVVEMYEEYCAIVVKTPPIAPPGLSKPIQINFSPFFFQMIDLITMTQILSNISVSLGMDFSELTCGMVRMVFDKYFVEDCTFYLKKCAEVFFSSLNSPDHYISWLSKYSYWLQITNAHSQMKSVAEKPTSKILGLIQYSLGTCYFSSECLMQFYDAEQIYRLLESFNFDHILEEMDLLHARSMLCETYRSHDVSTSVELVQLIIKFAFRSDTDLGIIFYAHLKNALSKKNSECLVSMTQTCAHQTKIDFSIVCNTILMLLINLIEDFKHSRRRTTDLSSFILDGHFNRKKYIRKPKELISAVKLEES